MEEGTGVGEPSSQLVMEQTGRETSRCLLAEMCRADLARLHDGARLDDFGKFERVRVLAAFSELWGGAQPAVLESLVTVGEMLDALDTATPEHGDPTRRIVLDLENLTIGSVRLRPLREPDFPLLYEASVSPSSSFRWRFRGSVPNRQQFLQMLEADVFVQMMCEDRLANVPLSLNVLYSVEPWAQSCYLGYIGVPGASDSMQRTGGLVLLLAYGFATWPLRKIYLEVPGFNVALLESLPRDVVREEGRLRDHYWHEGAWHDKVLLAIYREDFDHAVQAFSAPTAGAQPASAVAEPTST